MDDGQGVASEDPDALLALEQVLHSVIGRS